MNDRVSLPLDVENAALEKDATYRALQSILTSSTFAKAPRMCHLLSFLMKKKLDGKEREITEHAIGIEVFRRDVLVYDTLLDPVVRVQVCRLRSRLAAYHAAARVLPGVEISIPQGCYVPSIRVTDLSQIPPGRRQLELAPLRNLTGERDSGIFVSGLDDELGTRLFETLGPEVQLCTLPPMAFRANKTAQQVSHRLEGSIRVEHQRVRASMRLVDTNAGDIAWLSQFDRSGELGMQLQEELAGEICEKLRCYLASHAD